MQKRRRAVAARINIRKVRRMMRTNYSRIPDSQKRLVRKTKRVPREERNNCKVTQIVKKRSRREEKLKRNENSTRKRTSKRAVKVTAVAEKTMSKRSSQDNLLSRRSSRTRI